MIDFNTLIDPMTSEEFTNEYKGKKFCIIKGNRYRKFMYSNIISWSKFSEYINNDRAVSGLQAILPNGKKLCMEKDNYTKEMYLLGQKKIILKKNICMKYGKIMDQ